MKKLLLMALLMLSGFSGFSANTVFQAPAVSSKNTSTNAAGPATGYRHHHRHRRHHHWRHHRHHHWHHRKS